MRSRRFLHSFGFGWRSRARGSVLTSGDVPGRRTPRPRPAPFAKPVRACNRAYGSRDCMRPRASSASRSNGRLDFQLPKRRGHRRIAAEQDTMAAILDGVTVVPPVGVALHARSPVTYLKRMDFHTSDPHPRTPRELVHGSISVQDAQQIRRTCRRDHRGRRTLREAPQRRQVEVIHVRMGEQNQVDRRQFAGGKAQGATRRLSPSVKGPSEIPARVLNTGSVRTVTPSILSRAQSYDLAMPRAVRDRTMWFG